MQTESIILIINSGSSSIKFAIYTIKSLKKIYSGKIENIGSANTAISVSDILTDKNTNTPIAASDFQKAADALIDHLSKIIKEDELKAIGHRIVFGMKITEPVIIDENLLTELKKISSYDPDHLPAEIEIIEKLKKRFRQIMQVACFDTSFHTSMPAIAKMLPLPRAFREEGVQRYGFHGLSYSYLTEELEKKKGRDLANGKIILAHLGSGASLAAVKNGKCVDTSMGFTPTGGIMMGTRCGDLDPGIAWYMMERKKMSADQFNHLINHESGLLGVSGYTADMQELLQRRSTDEHGAEAVDLFCYTIKKWIGAFIAVLGGLDALVFSGGIGEHASPVRFSICNEFRYAGIDIDEEKNNKHAFEISTPESIVKVFVISTDEELVIARNTTRIYDASNK